MNRLQQLISKASFASAADKAEALSMAEVVQDLTPGEDRACPFCGGKVDPEGWGGHSPLDITVMIHGPACDDCGATAEDMETWNARVPPKPVKHDD